MKILGRYNFNKKMTISKEMPLTIINTPLGFGKTTSTKFFLEKEKLDYIWISVQGEMDENWIWSKITTALDEKFIHPDIYFKDTYFPKSAKEIEYLQTLCQEKITHPVFIVLDDVDMVNIPQFLVLFKLYSEHNDSLLHFIIITSDQDKSPFIDLTLKNNCLFIETQDLVLTRDEIKRLCTNEQVFLSDDELAYLYQSTEGWMTAVQFMLMAFKRNRNLYNLNTLDSLIEEAFYNQLDPEAQIGFMKLSILKNFTLAQAYDLTQSKKTYIQLLQLEKEDCFIHPTSASNYQIMPTLLTYLNKKLLMTQIDIQQLKLEAGFWYEQHHLPFEAMEIYLSCQEYEHVLAVLEHHSELSFTDIKPNFIYYIFKQLPEEYKNSHPITYLRWINDMITNIDVQEGLHLLNDFKNRLDNKMLVGDEQWLLGEYYFVLAFTKFNDTKKMSELFYQASLCFNNQKSKLAYPNMIATFGSNHMLGLYLNKLGTIKSLTSNISKYAHYFNIISGDVNAGADYQVKAEAAFETGDYHEVENLAMTAYQLAMKKKQESIVIANLFLRGRYAILFKQPKKLKSCIQELKVIYNKTNIPILHAEIDCSLAYLRLLNNEFQDVAKWIESGQIYDASLLHEAHSIAYITYGLYLIKKKHFYELNAISDILQGISFTTYVFNAIYSKLYKTVALYQSLQMEEATQQFKELLQLCRKDQIMTPIVELSDVISHLFEIVIPKNVFEKKLFKEVYRFNENKPFTQVKPKSVIENLTKKERQVLALLVTNKTLRDISKELDVSINTIQSHTKSIYTKLQVNTKLEAIRIYEKEFKD